MKIQAYLNTLQQRMWDLEEQMRQCDDLQVCTKLRDQWRFVMMEISEIEEEYGFVCSSRPSSYKDSTTNQHAA